MNPGMYEAASDVYIRREPRIVEYKVGRGIITNIVGFLNAGKQRMIYSFYTDKNNATWGRVSEADAAGVSEWVCVQNVNRVFMRPVVNEPLPSTGTPFERLDRLEAWARSQGYKG